MSQGKIVSSYAKIVCVIAVYVVIGAALMQSAFAQEPTPDLLAAQSRKQGYHCNERWAQAKT